ncbi:MAG: Acetyl-coenzyme A synthetase [Firmicutes bacterium ADurb.Bin248]|nr:MAG: Acetyl-coenzyme A synthetase [Firmicutes bacterium ADurb.Bin248]HOG00894.1 AMP-binding protein [Clostridia bacterium]HPK16036.1 AMP-binding protein [Clostridia bacterium]
MESTTGLDFQLQEMAARIRELRSVMGLSVAEMALRTGVSEAEYVACEFGAHDLSFAFIYRCAMAFNVNVTDIIEGTSPTLRGYTVTRAGEGARIEQAHGMVYYNLAAPFRNRISEPLLVDCAYSEQAERRDIELTTHEGQECDLVISGTLKLRVGAHTEILHPGDCAYYDSSIPHGMIAAGGENCRFYAIVLNPTAYRAAEGSAELKNPGPAPEPEAERERVWTKFVRPETDEQGALRAISFTNEETFNFAFDVADALAAKNPDKLAMLHIAKDGAERRFTFADIRRASNQCANYFKSLGIKKGDRVMLVLKRHHQFWPALLGLHKLGAVAIPATYLLQGHDYAYRFGKAGVAALLCTADGDAAHNAELGMAEYPAAVTKILVGGRREGWHDFDGEYPLFSGRFPRGADAPCGSELMLMFFTSGTTGQPKLAAHSYKYPLGHFLTAKYWQCADPEGLHLTVSDTGWAKAMWGKLYGQWLCEAAVFVYDFDRFEPSDILPMFARHNITSFCAPPTMYRMLAKEDLSQYDLSGVRHASIAGEALNPEVFRQIEKATGMQLMEGFGQSETTLVIGNLTGGAHKVGSMGKPVPLYDVDLVDPEGNPVETGSNGEIVIRIGEGEPCGLFAEYYNDGEATREAKRDGLYHTGDLAWRDEDGYYWYVGRMDDVIKSSGYRIGPFEIENVLMELAYVLECGVSAAPDEVRGQVIKASIVLTAGTQATDELKREIQDYVKSRTAPYKYPRIVVFRESLPKTTSGKIIRRLL